MIPVEYPEKMSDRADGGVHRHRDSHNVYKMGTRGLQPALGKKTVQGGYQPDLLKEETTALAER